MQAEKVSIAYVLPSYGVAMQCAFAYFRNQYRCGREIAVLWLLCIYRCVIYIYMCSFAYVNAAIHDDVS